jgi:predicted transcriptional regulator
MSAISLRLPDNLHRSVREMADKEHVSINQMITLALAEKISSLMTEEYLGLRAKHGSKAKFLKAMGKVAKTEPEPKDKLR